MPACEDPKVGADKEVASMGTEELGSSVSIIVRVPGHMWMDTVVDHQLYSAAYSTFDFELKLVVNSPAAGPSSLPRPRPWHTPSRGTIEQNVTCVWLDDRAGAFAKHACPAASSASSCMPRRVDDSKPCVHLHVQRTELAEL
jgi:hypothetical protein